MKILQIKYKNQNFESKIDDEDLDWIAGRSLKIAKCGNKFYVKMYIGHQKYDFLHRLILKKYNLLKQNRVDHKDADSLNNQKNNLRSCTRSQNAANTFKWNKSASSQYKGVTKHGEGGWYARIKINQKYICIASFPTERLAAIAYDIFAKTYFGEFARFNIENPAFEEILEVFDFLAHRRESKK